MEEKMVAEELRAGYLYKEKVLRPSLVAVSTKPKKTEEDEQTESQSGRHLLLLRQKEITEEEC